MPHAARPPKKRRETSQVVCLKKRIKNLIENSFRLQIAVYLELYICGTLSSGFCLAAVVVVVATVAAAAAAGAGTVGWVNINY